MRRNKYNYDRIVIGEYQDLIEESIGKFGNKTITVRGSEGPIPHFHIEIPGKPDCCICIYEPLYFIHGSKSTTLSNSQIDKLNKWLSEPNKIKNNKYALTNWQMIAMLWDTIYNDYPIYLKNIPDNPKQPEYYYNMDNKINIKESTSLFDFDLL